MKEREPAASLGKATRSESEGQTAATPGRESLASKQGGEPSKPGLFSGEETWEAIGENEYADTPEQGADAKASEGEPDETAEAKPKDGDEAKASEDSAEGNASEERADESAETNTADELAEVKAGLDEEMTALAGEFEEHTCFAGCIHGQFDSMMSAFSEVEAETSTGSPFKIAPGAVEEAARRAKGATAVDAPTAQPLPIEGVGRSTGDELGFGGTVSAGKPGGFPKVLGLAKWNYGKFTYPTLKVTTAKETDKSYTASIQSTTSADAATSAVATPAGTYSLGSQSLKNPDTNKQVRMAKQLEVGADAATQIKAAEQEHLDDVSQAYNITLKAAADAVNAQASSTFNDKSKANAIKAAKESVKGALHTKLGADPRKWRAMLQKCANLTRSGRDKSKWHSFNYFADGNDIDFANKTITYKVLNNPNIGTVSSESLIEIK